MEHSQQLSENNSETKIKSILVKQSSESQSPTNKDDFLQSQKISKRVSYHDQDDTVNGLADNQNAINQNAVKDFKNQQTNKLFIQQQFNNFSLGGNETDKQMEVDEQKSNQSQPLTKSQKKRNKKNKHKMNQSCSQQSESVDQSKNDQDSMQCGSDKAQLSEINQEIMQEEEEKKEEHEAKQKQQQAKGGVETRKSLRKRIKEFNMFKKPFQAPRVGVVYDEEMLLHKKHRTKHVERPERVSAIYLNLLKKGIYEELVEIEAVAADDKDLLLVHPKSHIQRIQATKYDKTGRDELDKHQNTCSFNSTYENKFTAQSAYISCGGTIEGVTAVCSDKVDYSFCIVRPPGHHAHCQSASGFCFFNNVAVAAKVAQQQYGIQKVCIFDWDVHVGDGTSEVFYEDNSVLYCSIHRFDMGKFFPGPKGKHDRVGMGKGYAYNIHFPFNVNKNQKDSVGDKEFIYACETIFFPIIREFKPDLILISAGFDAAKGDPLGGCEVSPLGYAYMTQGLRRIQNKLACVLEGGYDLHALEVSSEAVVKVLQTHPNDTDQFNKILTEFGAPEGSSYDSLQMESLIQPRESFRQTASSIAKLVKKTWPFLEPLIYEKPRRKSSNVAKSEFSSGSKNQSNLNNSNSDDKNSVSSFKNQINNSSLANNSPMKVNARSRIYSYQVENPIQEILPDGK